MKVLITGGYGFIGSFVAERFFKEGYEVYIIDNLSTGNKQNVDFKHKGYVLSVEDRKCEEIFRSNRFDTVVHLAAQVSVKTSVEDPRLDSKSNVLGLSNMLSLSQKYNVHKFIFASSAAVYGNNDEVPLLESSVCNPISPYGINKWIGETYCNKWKQLYGLDTLCFRFSNVYGPRQGSVGEGGVISIFMEKVINGKELVVYGDGGQSRDFIYVEDVADAIYRSSYSGLDGVYNLSANTENSVNELISALQGLHGSVAFVHSEQREGDIYRSKLDNRRIANDLDWVPKNSFQEGLAKTYDWFVQKHASQEQTRVKAKKPSAPSRLGQVIRTLMPYAENALAFGFTAWMSLLLRDSLSDFIDIKIIYIILLGILYGNRQSMLAVGMSTALYIYDELSKGREMLSLFYDTDFFFHVAVYLFIGLVVGYTVERKNTMLESKKKELESLSEKHEFLTEVFKETRQVKDELQQQIMNNGDSFGKIYSVVKELESLEPEKIFTSTVSVVESVMKSQTVTIYTVNKYGSYLRLLARSSGTQFDASKSMKVEDFPYIQKLLHDKKLFVNKDLKGDIPLLAAPVFNNGKVVAVISVHTMKFDYFTLYHQNLFKIIVDLISSSLSRALSYVEATAIQRYMDGTPVLKPEVFADILASKQVANAKHGVEFMLLTPIETFDVTDETPQKVSRFLRETDYLGMSMDGKLLVLLSNSSQEEASFVLNRFEQNGIYMRMVDEEFSYA
ncbi:NAD-dependent epimerase/dehydratase family protein [Paenibacillus sp. LMG 31460]|uniref:NAD-dependent epimerase/dehydratase family protein n=1 Tax=Paenibacillus germinis TaxID=2654979 RepID=A0ABX1YTU4_9BACL|nr:NAD-dependent epimerase/dehydratase family protein [Paenibacillus germinis]NOU84525.1 NAD-dependent epimerase/dehydratase family protein [Paenibacillus germinis]